MNRTLRGLFVIMAFVVLGQTLWIAIWHFKSALWWGVELAAGGGLVAAVVAGLRHSPKRVYSLMATAFGSSAACLIAAYAHHAETKLPSIAPYVVPTLPAVLTIAIIVGVIEVHRQLPSRGNPLFLFGFYTAPGIGLFLAIQLPLGTMSFALPVVGLAMSYMLALLYDSRRIARTT